MVKFARSGGKAVLKSHVIFERQIINIIEETLYIVGHRAYCKGHVLRLLQDTTQDDWQVVDVRFHEI